MDLMEKELMLFESKASLRKKEKTISVFPVDDETLEASKEYESDERTRLMFIMRSRPVEYGDIYKLDILNSDMKRISIMVDGCSLVRARDIESHADAKSMGLTLSEDQTLFEAYKEYMGRGGIVITPDTYVFCVHFSYCDDEGKK